MFIRYLAIQFHDAERIFSGWKQVSLPFLCGFHIRESHSVLWKMTRERRANNELGPEGPLQC
jgi:hypothetical protein